MGLYTLVLLLSLHGDVAARPVALAATVRARDSVIGYLQCCHAHHRPLPRSRRQWGLLADDDDTDNGPGPRHLLPGRFCVAKPYHVESSLHHDHLHDPTFRGNSLALIYLFCTILI
ncbi:MAG TPA: hypothetical protein VFA18_13490 [Gemmataceae bacterium]|nr:hypothetical protein [Gemmataceae bacterium]